MVCEDLCIYWEGRVMSIILRLIILVDENLVVNIMIC